jgi:hypothetical protein
MRFVELPAEFVGNDFKASAQGFCIEDDRRTAPGSVPPRA